MEYKEQLNCREWKVKRNAILERDGYRCGECYNKSLIETHRISFIGAGMTLSNLVYIVYDNITGNSYRCRTTYDKTFLFELLRISKHKSVLALTTGNGDFCKLVATVELPVKLDYAPVSELYKDDEVALKHEKQHIQETYLKSLTHDELGALKWLDTKSLHIHHKYYQLGKLAWEYPNDALITLCWQCHEILHGNMEIDVLDEKGDVIGKRTVCSRCHGAGWFPDYNHIEGGVCFRCSGGRFEE